jgi:predicted metal-dependent phosphoesterase TrpH
MCDDVNPILECPPDHVPVPAADRESGAWRRAPGVRIDLHCHSTFSDERMRWLPGFVYHPVLSPEKVYDLAKARGMDFVTLTDHDTIDGCKALLDARGPLRDFITGEEVSVAFPEDGTIIHVNAYDHNEPQHREIQRRRGNLYDLVAYLRQLDKLYVLNHITWTQQRRVLAPWQIEKMLELFPVFEGLNGTRSYAHNAFAWQAARGHDKVFVAGSDSHTVRVGTTFTRSAGRSPAELIASIRAGRVAVSGAFGTAEKLADDVWLCLYAEAERRIADARTAWGRGTCRVARQLARTCYRLACRGYHARQNRLIRGFAATLPA